jgi:hypothetical protein
MQKITDHQIRLRKLGRSRFPVRGENSPNSQQWTSGTGKIIGKKFQEGVIARLNRSGQPNTRYSLRPSLMTSEQVHWPPQSSVGIGIFRDLDADQIKRWADDPSPPHRGNVMRSRKSVAAKVLAKWWKTCHCLSVWRNDQWPLFKGVIASMLWNEWLKLWY